MLSESDTDCIPTLASGDTNSNNILETSETWTYGCTLLAVTDVLDGDISTNHSNIVAVSGQDVLNTSVVDDDTETVDIIGSAVAITKSPSSSFVREGDTVTYTFVVTSSGDPVSSVAVDDTDADCDTSLVGPTGDDGDNELEAGESWQYTCDVAVTDALDGTANTDHTNGVAVVGNDPLGLQVTGTDTETVDIVDATIAIAKSASASAINEGGTVTYTFVVTSSGDPVSSVAVDDTDGDCDTSLAGPTGDDGDSVLEAGESWQYTCDVAVTDALDGTANTDHTNGVAVVGNDPSGFTISDTDSETVDIVASSVAITKTSDRVSVHEGDTVTYTFEVTSTGDPIAGVTVSDTDAPCNASLSGPVGDDGDALLEAGERWTYSCEVTVTDALDGTSNTDHSNTVDVAGTDPAGTPVVNSAIAAVDIVASAIGITKTANPTSLREGDTVTYTFDISVVGDPVHEVVLDDTDADCDTTLSGPTGDDGDHLLEDGEIWSYTCVLSVTDALDGDIGTDHENTVDASAKDPADTVVTATARETVDIVGSTVAITKTPNLFAIHEGDIVTYTFDVTGTGDPQTFRDGYR